MTDVDIAPRPVKRAQQACDTCRRKKTRCPGEKPACSTCRRASIACHYSATQASKPGSSGADKRSSTWKERVEELEQKIALFSRSRASSGTILSTGETSEQPSSEGKQGGPSWMTQPNCTPRPATDSSNLQRTTQQDHGLFEGPGQTELPPSHILSGLAHLYIKQFEGQPLPLFVADVLCNNPIAYNQEVLYAIVGLTMQFSDEASTHLSDIPSAAQYITSSRNIVLGKLGYGMVDLGTLQAICLLAYEDLMSENRYRASLFVGMGIRLARSAGLNRERAGCFTSLEVEERRRCFWCLRLLDIFSSSGHDALDRLPEPVPSYPSTEVHYGTPSHHSAESTLPREDITRWTISIAELWSQVLSYTLSERTLNTQPLWAPDSQFVKLDLLTREFEMTLSNGHRWHNIGISERKGIELRQGMAYWGSWLFLQFTYHATHCLLYHPYSLALEMQQRGEDVPIHFRQQCQTSSLLHANWIDRFICIVEEKGTRISDPFLAYCAAVAVTVHLFSANSTHAGTQNLAKDKIRRCLKFIQGLGTTWPIAKRISNNMLLLSTTRPQWKSRNGMIIGVETTDADLKALAAALTYPPAEDPHDVGVPFLHRGLMGQMTGEAEDTGDAPSYGYDDVPEDIEAADSMSRSLDLLSECPEYINYDWDQALLSDYYRMGYL